jgi:hypothetical protein
VIPEIFMNKYPEKILSDMQELLTFQICFLEISVRSPIQNSDGPLFIEDGTLWADNKRNFNEKTIIGNCPNSYFPCLTENEIAIGL